MGRLHHIERFLILLLAAIALAVPAWAADPPARVVAITVDPEGQHLVLQVDRGAFDPVVRLEPRDQGGYRIVIEGENVELEQGLKHDTLALTELLSRRIADVESVNLFQTSENGQSMVRLVLDIQRKLQPQVRSNTGSLVTIALVGDPKSTPPASSKKPSVASETRPPASSNSSSAALPAVSAPVRHQIAPYGVPGPVFSIYRAVQEPSVDGVVRQAWETYRQGRPESARMALEAYLEKMPADKVARYLLALVYMTGNDSQRATMALQKLLDGDPDFLPAWLALIDLSIAQGHFPEAEDLVNRAADKMPERAELAHYRGLLAEARGDLAAAQDHYLQALARDPNNRNYRYRLAVVSLKANKPQSAELELKHILMTQPDDVGVLKAMGFLKQQEQKPADAMTYYRKALKPDVLINYALLIGRENRLDEAMALFRAAEVIAPDDPEIQYNLGMIYNDFQQRESTVRTLNRFIELVTDKSAGEAKDGRLIKARSTLKTLGTAPTRSTAPASKKTGQSRTAE